MQMAPAQGLLGHHLRKDPLARCVILIISVEPQYPWIHRVEGCQ